ncbi:MAG: hypothetical protein ACT4ON_11125 [Bacteroidota bacterium]
MKKTNLILVLIFITVVSSCKKEKTTQPQPTTPPTTNASLATSLSGVWTVYGNQYYNNGVWNGGTSTCDYKIKFTATQYFEDFDNNGIYEYAFDATYSGSTISYSGYDNTSTLRYGAFEATASGNEFRLKASNNSNHGYVTTNPDYIVYLIKR